MKRFFAVFVLLIAAATMSFAQGINLENFPKGKWLDANWNAVWEFDADNIRLLDANGTVLFDFKDKISDFKVDVNLTEAKISFTCAASGRKYEFTKGIKDLGLTMSINRNWTSQNYRVEMTFQQ